MSRSLILGSNFKRFLHRSSGALFNCRDFRSSNISCYAILIACGIDRRSQQVPICGSDWREKPTERGVQRSGRGLAAESAVQPPTKRKSGQMLKSDRFVSDVQFKFRWGARWFWFRRNRGYDTAIGPRGCSSLNCFR